MTSAPDSLPLIRHFEAASPLAQVHGLAVDARQFIAHASSLASRLPRGRYVLNVCEDRYNFLVGFAAALIARQTTLMPPSRAIEAIAQVQDNYADSYCLSDQASHAAMPGYQMVAPFANAGSKPKLQPKSNSHPIPDIPAQLEAAILFTSGSTGQPSAHPKTWGMLVQGADQLQRTFDAQPGSCVVGTVPPQHMFGLESTIMFPLQWGCTIYHGRPHLPADIEQVVSAASAPVWLMTTPLHLRACVAEAPRLPGLAGAISATMPLDHAAALAAEQVLHCPLHEIYGCTEAGIVGTRRPALQSDWRLCPDFRLRQDGEQSWLEGARVAQPLALNDDITLHADGRFSLQGRIGDMIKIAGKRSSLAALNAELLAIDGVIDGSFYRPEPQDGHSHDNQRLTVFVVTERLQTTDVITALRQRIDPVFVPRPIWRVPQLPRDANGKLPRAALANLAAALSAQLSAHRAPAAPLPPLHYEGVIAAGHPALNGHFPGRPIVPGVLLLCEVMRLAARRYSVCGIKQAKFHVPLLPQQAYAISLSEASATAVKFSIHQAHTLIASGSLKLEAAHEPA